MGTNCLPIWLLDVAASFMELGLNWLVQSSLLLVGGLWIGRMARRRGPAAQSAVHRATLVAVLVCPLATWGLTSLGVPGWSIDLPAAWTMANLPAGHVASVAESAPTHSEPSAAAQQRPDFSPNPLNEHSANLAHTASASEPSQLGVASAPTVNASTTQQASEPPRLVVHRFGLIASAACLVWFVAVVTLLARLAVTWRKLARIRKSATPAGPDTLAVCGEVARRIGVIAPEVKHSPYLSTPCLTGLRRPTVLLPETTLGMGLRDVLIHELAHLRRRDCRWNVVCRFALAVAFFQPLLWILVRRLLATSEEVCDDFVVVHGNDRRAYARGLVDVAELGVSSLAVAGLGIVSFHSMLGTRVARIMDTSRALSTSPGRRFLALVIAGALLGTAIAGLVGIGPQPSTAVAEATLPSNGDDAAPTNQPTVVEKNTPASNNSAMQASEQHQISMVGRVVGPNGKPVAGAHVAVIARTNLPSRGGDLKPDGEVLAQAATGTDGHYRFTIRGVSSKTHRYTTLIVRADGLGCAWRPFNPDADALDLSFKLADERPIHGRLLDEKGQPAAGVPLSVRSIVPTAKEGMFSDGTGYYTNQDLPKAWPQSVTTDPQGRFVIHNVTPGHGVLLNIAGTDRFARQDCSFLKF